jgi:hypothetical protein
MDFFVKLNTLQQHLAKTKADADAAAKESRDKLTHRIDEAQADVNKEANEHQAAYRASGRRLKTDHHARMQELTAKIEQRNAQLDTAAAEGNADWADSDATDAIDFAA